MKVQNMKILFAILILILSPVITYILNMIADDLDSINIFIGLIQFALGICVYLDYRRNQNEIKNKQDIKKTKILNNIINNLESLNPLLYNIEKNPNSQNYDNAEYDNILTHLDTNANVLLGQIRISNNDQHEKLDIIHEITINAIFYARNCNYNKFIDRAISANNEINKIIKSEKKLITNHTVKYPCQ